MGGGSFRFGGRLFPLWGAALSAIENGPRHCARSESRPVGQQPSLEATPLRLLRQARGLHEAG